MSTNNSVLIQIAVADIRPCCAGIEDLEARLRAAFRQSHTFWMSTDDNVRFAAALVAAISETTSESEREQIARSKRALDAVSAALSGVPVNLDQALPEGFEPLPLIAWYREEAR